MPLNSDVEPVHPGPPQTARHFVFQPFVVLLFSIGGALLYAIWITWRFGGHNLTSQFVYVVPIVVPFVSFLFDRAEQFHHARIAGWAVDIIVVGTAMMRVVGNVPLVSGHTLFLTYAMLGPVSKVTRITASVVMIEVVYLKYFVWHDPVSSSTGIVLGAIAAVIAHWIGSKPVKESLSA